MKKVKFHSDQNKTSVQGKEKENSVPWYYNKYKEAKKLMREKQGKIYLCTQTLWDISNTNL